MNIIYRIEHPINSLGLWHNELINDEIKIIINTSYEKHLKLMPNECFSSEYQDIIDNGYMKYGFNSLDEINEWFSKEEMKIILKIYNLVKITVITCIKGVKQCMFLPNHIINKIDITNTYKN